MAKDCLQKWILIQQDQSLESQWGKCTKKAFHNTFSFVVWSVLVPDRFYITTGNSVISYQPLRREFIALPKFKCGHHFRQKKKNHKSLTIQVTWVPYFFSRIFISGNEGIWICVMCPNNWDNFFALIILNVFKENAYFQISSNINSNPEGMDYSVIQGSHTRKLKWSSDIFLTK